MGKAQILLTPVTPEPPDEIHVKELGHAVHASMLTDSAIKAIGREWTEGLLAKAKRGRVKAEAASKANEAKAS